MFLQSTDIHTPITLEEFKALQHCEKISLLEDEGVYLEVCRYAEHCKVALFKLWGFYCEVWLHVKSDKIIRVEGFGGYRKLDLYLSDIGITEVFALL